MRHHRLKTWPTYYDAVAAGEKLFEVRKNDRFFQCGDTVELVRLDEDKHSACYSRPWQILTFRVGPVLQGGQFGLEPGYCIFSLLPLGEPLSPTATSG